MLGKQAKVLTAAQERAVLAHLSQTTQPIRNKVIFLLSIRAGLRAKEIALLTWDMVTQSDGEISEAIHLRDSAAKGNSGGVVPIARDLRESLRALQIANEPASSGERVVTTKRRANTTAQVIVNMFAGWYLQLGFNGCSSHSGRRTFITRSARNIGKFGGSLRDVQLLARHRSLSMTQRYIDADAEAMRKVVEVFALHIH